MPFRGPPHRPRNRRVQVAAQPLIVLLDFLARRPVSGLIRRQAAAHRVDAKRKEVIKGRMKRLQPERALRQQVPIESFHVSNIKNNAMPFGDWPVVERLFPHHSEYFVGARACAQQAGVKVIAGADSSGAGSHVVFPSDWMRLPRERYLKIQRGEARCTMMFPPASAECQSK